jgi:hypothetical protein
MTQEGSRSRRRRLCRRRGAEVARKEHPKKRKSQCGEWRWRMWMV